MKFYSSQKKQIEAKNKAIDYFLKKKRILSPVNSPIDFIYSTNSTGSTSSSFSNSSSSSNSSSYDSSFNSFEESDYPTLYKKPKIEYTQLKTEENPTLSQHIEYGINSLNKLCKKILYLDDFSDDESDDDSEFLSSKILSNPLIYKEQKSPSIEDTCNFIYDDFNKTCTQKSTDDDYSIDKDHDDECQNIQQTIDEIQKEIDDCEQKLLELDILEEIDNSNDEFNYDYSIDKDHDEECYKMQQTIDEIQKEINECEQKLLELDILEEIDNSIDEFNYDYDEVEHEVEHESDIGSKLCESPINFDEDEEYYDYENENDFDWNSNYGDSYQINDDIYEMEKRSNSIYDVNVDVGAKVEEEAETETGTETGTDDMIVDKDEQRILDIYENMDEIKLLQNVENCSTILSKDDIENNIIKRNCETISLLKPGEKLNIVQINNGTRIEFEINIENSYIPQLSRWYYGQSRTSTIDCLRNLFMVISDKQCDNSIDMKNVPDCTTGLNNLKKTYEYDDKIAKYINNMIVIHHTIKSCC